MPVQRNSPKRTVQSVINDLIARVNEDTRRLRALEQDMSTVKARMISSEDSASKFRENMNKSFADVTNKIGRAEDKVARMEMLLAEYAKGMKRFAASSEIEKLEQLIEIYNPLKSQFITREEAEHMMEEKMEPKNR
jgi:hypothetical protein